MLLYIATVVRLLILQVKQLLQQLRLLVELQLRNLANNIKTHPRVEDGLFHNAILILCCCFDTSYITLCIYGICKCHSPSVLCSSAHAILSYEACGSKRKLINAI